MKLKDTFITHENDGEHILIDVTSSFVGLVRSNKTVSYTHLHLTLSVLNLSVT